MQKISRFSFNLTNRKPLPNLKQVFFWWNKFKMLENIRKHSKKVCIVAIKITNWLKDAGIILNKDLIIIGALTHDISKTSCLGTKKLHTQEGGFLLSKLGYPEIGHLISNHVFLADKHPLDEIMIVNYADKRVKHDKIVSLKNRFKYIIKHYGNKDKKKIDHIQNGLKQALLAENLIFEHLYPKHHPIDIKN